MSILNGAISAKLIHPAKPPFGETLTECAFLPIPGLAALAMNDDGTVLFAAAKNEMRAYRLTDGVPQLLSRLEGLGSARQAAFYRDTLYISTRAGGLDMVDVRDPLSPRHTGTLDTLELATGVSAADGLLLVTNRHMGVEIWSLDDPQKPSYLSSFLAGEAQSVTLDGGYAYAGDWMNRRVHVVDVRDPRHPQEVSNFQVDGFADGVFVRDGLCLVASGHHSARLKNRTEYQNYPYTTPEMFENGYGTGHGLTLYDVTLPDSPEYLSEVKFPPLFVSGNDTWLVNASNQFAYVADTYNGCFVVDIHDVLAPRIIGHFLLPFSERKPDEKPPHLQTLHKPASFILPGEGKLYAAGVECGLHILDFAPAKRLAPPSPPAPPAPALAYEPVFRTSGQIHAVTVQSGTLFAAAGNEGFFALDPNDHHVLHHIKTAGVAHDIVPFGDLLVTAEGRDGVASYRYAKEEGFRLLSRLVLPGDGVRQVVAFPKEQRMAAQVGCGEIAVLRLDNDGQFTLQSVTSVGWGLYHHHLCPDPHPAGYVVAHPLGKGLVFLDVKTGEVVSSPVPEIECLCPIEEGAAVMKDGTVIFIRDRRYALLRDPSEMPLLPERLRPVPGARFRGEPFIAGDEMILVNRATGYVEVFSISDIENPRLLSAARLPGHPECAVRLGEATYVACGHEGLFRLF